MRNRLFVAGAGGHGIVVAEAAMAMNRWANIVFLDDRLAPGSFVGQYPVMGPCDQLASKCQEDDSFVIAIGDNVVRLAMHMRAVSSGCCSATIIHPSAVLSDTASIGDGTVVMANSVVNARARVGIATIVNTAATIDHDCRLGQGVHISPGAHLAGCVTIGSNSWVGIGASIREGISIGNRAIVGAGAAVVSDVDDDAVVGGVPAKPVKTS